MLNEMHNRPDTNLSDAQIEAIERILELFVYDLQTLPMLLDGRVFKALCRTNILVQVGHEYQITPHGIRSYCATVLTKYTGATHERIHSALNDYQRLFNGGGTSITNS